MSRATCSKCGKGYRIYMGPLLEDFTRKGPRTKTVRKERRCESCGHLLGHKIWRGTDETSK